MECEKVFPPAGDFVDDFAFCGVNSFSSVKEDILSSGATFPDFGHFRKLWSDCRQEKHDFCSATFLLFELKFSL